MLQRRKKIVSWTPADPNGVGHFLHVMEELLVDVMRNHVSFKSNSGVSWFYLQLCRALCDAFGWDLAPFYKR